MKLQVLASSSKGNCYILRSGKSSLILDLGIGFSDVLKAVKHDLRGIQGVLCSHNHLDQNKCIKDALKHSLDVYTSQGTIEALKLKHHRAHVVKDRQITLGQFIVLPFGIEHDAPEP